MNASTVLTSTHRSLAALALAAVAISAAAVGAPPAPQDDAASADADAAPAPWFRDVGASAGVDFVHRADRTDRFRFPEIMGGGVALFDFDGDGDLDLYLVQGGHLGEAPADAPTHTNRLYRNDGADGEIRFTDVTEEAGVGHAGYGMGAACADYDRDGDIDLFVTNVGPNVMYRNEGDGTFTDVTEKLNLADARWGTSAGFFDADGKGGLDLYVVNNLAWSESIETPCVNYYQEPDYCSPANYNAPSTDILYTFGRLGYTNRTSIGRVETAFGNGLGITVADYDLDGDVDVYVANDATPNLLWNNDGRAVFENVAGKGGCAVNGQGRPEAGMGVQFVDLDDDGYLDLFITHLRRETNTFYRNKRGMFDDRSNMVGTNATSLNFTGFGMGIHDFDHDGTLDLYVANGAVQAWKGDERFAEDAYAEPNHVFRGVKGKRGVRFTELEGAAGDAGAVGTSRGAAFGDLDGDGDVDAVVVDLDARAKVLENVAADADSHWVGFRLVEGSKGAVVQGATVSIAGPDGETRWTRLADPAYSYLSSNDHRVHFGLGEMETAKDVQVRWPDGSVQSFGDLPAGAYHELKRER